MAIEVVAKYLSSVWSAVDSQAQVNDLSRSFSFPIEMHDDVREEMENAAAEDAEHDVLYVGPDSDASAIAFMRQLAAAAAGKMSINDIGSRVGAQNLMTHITAMLPGPSS